MSTNEQQATSSFNIELLVHGAARVAAGGGGEDLDRIIDLLVWVADQEGPGPVGDAVAAETGATLARVWEAGWQPWEVVREVRRRCDPRHADLLTTALAADGAWVGERPVAPPPAWAAQLRQLDVWRWWGEGRDWLHPWSGGPASRRSGDWSGALRHALDNLGVLIGLPRLEVLLPPPSQWVAAGVGPLPRGMDEPVLARVRALLAKAESTAFEPEADALTAKAQELMARHAIDEAVARHEDGPRRQRPTARRIPVDDPYASAKSQLLHAVGAANGVRTVWYEGLALMAVVGFDQDLDAVEVLFTSLLVQATRAMVVPGRVTGRGGRSRTRSFRQSFLVAFALRIGERLQQAAGDAREQARAEHGAALVPVLAADAAEVDDALTELFPRLKSARGPSVSNRDGWYAGRAAAELAVLGPEGREVTGRR